MAKEEQPTGKLVIQYQSLRRVLIENAPESAYIELSGKVGKRGSFHFRSGKKQHTIALNGIMHVEFEQG